VFVFCLFRPNQFVCVILGLFRSQIGIINDFCFYKTSCLPHFVCLCISEIISLPWLSKELKTTYRRTIGFMVSSLYFSFANQYSLGEGFSFPMPRYKLSLCHTPIKPDLLGFPGIGVFTCGLRDHEVRINNNS
jgi:hypothetical protein